MGCCGDVAKVRKPRLSVILLLLFWKCIPKVKSRPIYILPGKCATQDAKTLRNSSLWTYDILWKFQGAKINMMIVSL